MMKASKPSTTQCIPSKTNRSATTSSLATVVAKERARTDSWANRRSPQEEASTRTRTMVLSSTRRETTLKAQLWTKQWTITITTIRSRSIHWRNGNRINIKWATLLWSTRPRSIQSNIGHLISTTTKVSRVAIQAVKLIFNSSLAITEDRISLCQGPKQLFKTLWNQATNWITFMTNQRTKSLWSKSSNKQWDRLRWAMHQIAQSRQFRNNLTWTNTLSHIRSAVQCRRRMTVRTTRCLSPYQIIMWCSPVLSKIQLDRTACSLSSFLHRTMRQTFPRCWSHRIHQVSKIRIKQSIILLSSWRSETFNMPWTISLLCMKLTTR